MCKSSEHSNETISHVVNENPTSTETFSPEKSDTTTQDIIQQNQNIFCNQQSNYHAPKMQFKDNINYKQGVASDFDLIRKSEEDYIVIVKNIVDTSIEQLTEQRNSKQTLRDKFTNFFTDFIFYQFIVLILLVVFKTVFNISDSVIVSLVAAFFVETLGALIVMIKFAFDSKEETTILEILNSVVRNFQKFNK